MIIKTLVENTSNSENLKSVHGLSLYIETKLHKILFDLGPGKLFLENARKMNIAIENIDTVIISHGHYDHGGALKLFLENNNKAKIYIRDNAFQPFYTKFLFLKIPIGLDSSLQSSDRLFLTNENYRIDQELLLFSDVKNALFYPMSNKKLLQNINHRFMPDDFSHEQSLLVMEDNKYTLFAGCAHKGIVNIVEKAEELSENEIKTVIGGFHLFQTDFSKEANRIFIDQLSQELKKKQTIYYTCHCTGKKAYRLLHDKMGDQMRYIATGDTVFL